MLGETIKQIRIKHGLSQQELADKVGCRRETINHAENGNGTNMSILFKIAEALNANIMCVQKGSKYHKVISSTLSKNDRVGDTGK